MTETERSETIKSYEPLLGAPGVKARTVLARRIKELLIVDIWSKSAVFVYVTTHMAWKLLDKGKLVSDVAVIAVVGLMALAWMNWCMRKHVGPIMEALAAWIAGARGKLSSSPPPAGNPQEDK